MWSENPSQWTILESLCYSSFVFATLVYGVIGYKFCWLLPQSRSTSWTRISWDTNWARITYPHEWSKWYVIMKFVAIVIHLREFNICSLKLEYVSWSHNKMCNSRIGEIILIGDNTTFSYHGHQFMGGLHVMSSRS